MGIVSIVYELPRHPTKRYGDESADEIDTIVIHHSAANYQMNQSTVKQLIGFAEYHIRKHGWPGLAYHYAIDPFGIVYKCNPIERRGYTWHAKGGNDNSIGILVMGHFDKIAPTHSQMHSLRDLVKVLRDALPKELTVLGHRDVKGSSTACPGGNFTPEMIAMLNHQ